MGVLYLTRHGETIWNTEWRLQGHLDSPLTAKGLWQAERLRDRIKNFTIDVIYTSPSQRAFRTAMIIQGGRSIPVIPHEGLMEINLGIWEGQTSEEISEAFPEAFHNFWYRPERYIPVSEGAETYEQVQSRLSDCIREITESHKDQTILVVTHALALKAFLLAVENRPIEDLFVEPVIHSASLTRVDFDATGMTVKVKNDATHLETVQGDAAF